MFLWPFTVLTRGYQAQFPRVSCASVQSAPASRYHLSTRNLYASSCVEHTTEIWPEIQPEIIESCVSKNMSWIPLCLFNFTTFTVSNIFFASGMKPYSIPKTGQKMAANNQENNKDNSSCHRSSAMRFYSQKLRNVAPDVAEPQREALVPSLRRAVGGKRYGAMGHMAIGTWKVDFQL